jgi:hypothetical protein
MNSYQVAHHSSPPATSVYDRHAGPQLIGGQTGIYLDYKNLASRRPVGIWSGLAWRWLVFRHFRLRPLIARSVAFLRATLSAALAEFLAMIKAIVRVGTVLIFWCATAGALLLAFSAFRTDQAATALAALKDTGALEMLAKIGYDGPSAVLWGLVTAAIVARWQIWRRARRRKS